MDAAMPKKFTLTAKRRKHILEHPEMKNQLGRMNEALRNPDIVKRSIRSENILLFYKHYPTTPVTEKILCVIVRATHEEGFILTAYFTDRLKPGETIWEKQRTK